MVIKTKYEVCCTVIFVASLLYFEDILGLEWNSKYIQSYFKLTSLPNSISMNEKLVSEVKNTSAVASCVRFCVRNQRSSLYYNKHQGICYCNNNIDSRLNPSSNTTDDGSSEIIYGSSISLIRVSTNSSTLKYDVQPYKDNCFALYHHGYMTNAIYTVQPKEGIIQDTNCNMDNVLDIGAGDCLQWFQAGYTDDGVYNIRLSNATTVKAWCDQTNGGRTLFQHRQDGSVNFYRTWAEYVNGFGDAAGEYWLGLEAIYLLCQRPSSFRIDMEAFGDKDPLSAYALYDTISLKSATDNYRLSLGEFSGDCGDSLTNNDQQQFTTRDSDNDRYHVNCATFKKGAWWFNQCSAGNLNGLYRRGNYSGAYTGMHWKTCWGYLYSMKTSSLGIKRN